MGIKELKFPDDGMSVEELLEGLEGELLEIMIRAIDSPRFTVFELSAACRDDGYEITPTAFLTYRLNSPMWGA